LVLDGYQSANEDEDSLTGDMGGVLRIKNKKVKVSKGEINGTWTWSINYKKFRDKGNNATERIIGADGIFELEVKSTNRIEKKSVLFQSKKNLYNDPKLVEQALLLSTWREASFILNFEPDNYDVYSIDSILKSRGKRPINEKQKNLRDLLTNDFLECKIGDADLQYDAVKRLLIWRSIKGVKVATKFSIPHRIQMRINAPAKTFRSNRYSKELDHSEIHNYRMDASQEEMLSLSGEYSKEELTKAKKKMSLLYHPDKFNLLDGLQKDIANRRMQEILDAHNDLEKITLKNT